VDELLVCGASVNARGRTGRAIDGAAKHGHVVIVEKLLAAGARCDRVKGISPLENALKGRHYAAAAALVDVCELDHRVLDLVKRAPADVRRRVRARLAKVKEERLSVL